MQIKKLGQEGWTLKVVTSGLPIVTSELVPGEATPRYRYCHEVLTEGEVWLITSLVLPGVKPGCPTGITGVVKACESGGGASGTGSFVLSLRTAEKEKSGYGDKSENNKVGGKQTRAIARRVCQYRPAACRVLGKEGIAIPTGYFP
jgi:hypothetical protein